MGTVQCARLIFILLSALIISSVRPFYSIPTGHVFSKPDIEAECTVVGKRILFTHDCLRFLTSATNLVCSSQLRLHRYVGYVSDHFKF